MKREYIAPTAQTIMWHAEASMLTGSQEVRMSDTAVDADASLSNQREYKHPIWGNE